VPTDDDFAELVSAADDDRIGKQAYQVACAPSSEEPAAGDSLFEHLKIIGASRNACVRFIRW
jgi:hypothetical protein